MLILWIVLVKIFHGDYNFKVLVCAARWLAANNARRSGSSRVEGATFCEENKGFMYELSNN